MHACFPFVSSVLGYMVLCAIACVRRASATDGNQRCGRLVHIRHPKKAVFVDAGSLHRVAEEGEVVLSKTKR